MITQATLVEEYFIGYILDNMAKVRLDRVLMCSLFESFKNYRADDPLLEFSITTSGSIPPGGKNFEHTVSFERTGTISDIYYKLSTANYKRPLNILGRAVDTASGEIISPYVIYSSSSVRILSQRCCDIFAPVHG